MLLTIDGVPKITDFGLAKWLDVPSRDSRSGVVVGTPGYMAPEQARGQTSLVGPATDVYALGAILYEMLTGRPPFHAATTQETVQQLLTEDPVPPSRLQPRVARDLETICLKCLQKEPGRRYAGADALALDLRCFLSGRPILARPTPSWERVAKWTQRRPAVAVLIGFSVVATVALFALSLAHNARLRHERAIASAERDAARKAQQQSEADFGLALDAVKRFYTEVSENKLLLVPTMDTVRIELLERACEFYERIAQERPERLERPGRAGEDHLASRGHGRRQSLGSRRDRSHRADHRHPGAAGPPVPGPAGIPQRPGPELQQPGHHAPFEQSTGAGSRGLEALSGPAGTACAREARRLPIAPGPGSKPSESRQLVPRSGWPR